MKIYFLNRQTQVFLVSSRSGGKAHNGPWQILGCLGQLGSDLIKLKAYTLCILAKTRVGMDSKVFIENTLKQK